MFVAVTSKLPVAMAPIVFVFLVRERPDGYSVGAAPAAAHVLGEVLGGALLGLREGP